jgi:alpha-D-ribose 1-methylphosphonate 5-triphosphate synthase subunit PhnI
MVKRKRWSKYMHHRVPDFKLVYCGPKKTNPKEETEHGYNETVVEVSDAIDRDGVVVSKLEKQ